MPSIFESWSVRVSATALAVDDGKTGDDEAGAETDVPDDGVTEFCAKEVPGGFCKTFVDPDFVTAHDPLTVQLQTIALQDELTLSETLEVSEAASASGLAGDSTAF